MFRSLLLPLLSLSLAAQTTTPPPPKPVKKPAAAAKPAVKKDTVLATINGKPVMESEFLLFLDMAYNPQQRMQIGMVEGAMEQVQEQYLRTRLFEAKARKDGMDKTPAYNRKRAIMEMDLLVRSFFDREGAKLEEKIKVSDADVKAFYDKNTDKFKTPETFTARHILVNVKEPTMPEEPKPAPDAKPKTEQEQKADQDAREKALAEARAKADDEAKAKVAKIQEELKSGKKFEDVAKEYSDDPGSKDKGGLYENVSFGSFVPEFEAAVRTQKPGEVGQPVKTQFGYHLIEVEKISPSEIQSFEASKEKAQQMATQQRQEQVMKELVDSVKKEIPYVESLTLKKPKVPATATGGN
jgi:peptidyl-prolyl cis-trans isomerase C